MRWARPSFFRFFWLSTLWAFALGAWLELSDQEAYYWMWSKVPALCYYEHPPLQAWITGALTWILGDGAWVVRLPALTGRAFTIFFFWRWSRRRYGEHCATLACWTLGATFLFSGGALFALPDAVMLPFAVMAMDWSEQRRPWRAGLALGFAALGKWTAAVLVPGVSAAFLLRRRRDWRGFFITGLTALALQTPVLVWNAQHNWDSFRFHLIARHNHVLTPGQQVASLASFGAAQFLIGGLGLLIALIYALRFLWRRDLWRARLEEISLLWWILPAFLVFGLSARGGELRFYWTDVSFLPLSLLLARAVARQRPEAKEAFVRWQRRAWLFTMLFVTAVLLLPVGSWLRPLTDRYKPFDMRHSPRGDLKGWGEWLREDLGPRGLLSPDVALIASDFHLAAQAAWAAGIHDMSRVGTATAPFQFAYWPRPTRETFHRAVFFGDNRHRLDDFFVRLCAVPVQWQKRTITLMGEPVKEIPWAVCENFSGP